MEQDAVIAQLGKILASAQFAQSRRLSRFLRLIVEETLRGKADHLKEYRIGVEVFDRSDDFDPRLDSIVRVQAAKLRSKLLEFYAAEGANDAVTIAIPRGSYAADIQIVTRDPALPAARAEPAAPSSSDAKSRIAVLPFVSMSSDPENEYFSDGLTEELINRLAHVSALNVVARTSAFSFKGRNEDVRDIGKKLNVGTILEGSVRRSDQHLRVTAQLIDVETGFHLFSRTYHRELKGVFELQDELANAVVAEITPSKNLAGSNIRTASLDAYSAYLRGTFLLSNNFLSLPTAIDHFRESLRLDPNFAPAWAGIAQAYFQLAWFLFMPAKEALPLSKQAALKTLELDPESALGHSSLGLVESGFEWRWESADARFKRAIALQPSLAMIYPFYASVCLLPQRRFGEACDAVERALALDPFNPLFHAMATLIYYSAGRMDDALRQNMRGMGINANFPPLVGSGGVVLEFQGDFAQAIARFRRCCELTMGRPMFLGFLAHTLAITGQNEEARQILERLLAMPVPSALDIARVYLGFRDTDRTLNWLERALEERNIHLLAVPVDRRFDWLRNHPRFQDVLQRISVPAWS